MHFGSIDIHSTEKDANISRRSNFRQPPRPDWRALHSADRCGAVLRKRAHLGKRLRSFGTASAQHFVSSTLLAQALLPPARMVASSAPWLSYMFLFWIQFGRAADFLAGYSPGFNAPFMGRQSWIRS
jgi:hypothetical protein